MGSQAWIVRIGLAAAACATLAILGFYASRLAMPLPLFAGDEATYLIRALYADVIVAADPYVLPVNNGIQLSVIRAVYATGAPFIVGDRLVNAAAYLTGIGLLWRASVRGLPRREQIALGLLVLAFPYYRFACSNLAEGLYVGVLAVLCLVTARWFRSRPMLHALLAGAICAVLVLVKPNGVAVASALGALAVLDAWVSGDWRRLPVRLAIFAATFFALGNLIQWAAEEPAAHPLNFFVGEAYGNVLAQEPPPHALAIAALVLGSMTSAMAILVGAPIVVGLSDLVARWRSRRDGFAAEGADRVLLLLVLSLAATLVMVTIFAIKIASTPGESGRLWGRYFEYFAPLIWLAAAPALARPIGRRTAWSCAVVTLSGLAGLLLSFRAGIVLFPWDSSALTAFFAPDPVRASLGPEMPYRALAVAATVLAAALLLKARPAYVGLALVLALGGLSTRLDHVWLGPLVQQRYALERDIRAILPRLPPEPAPVVLLAPDANDGHLGFLRLQARPHVVEGPPGQVSPAELVVARAVVVSGPETPPAGPWRRTYKGEVLSLYEPATSP
jgi:hypothetical protein